MNGAVRSRAVDSLRSTGTAWPATVPLEWQIQRIRRLFSVVNGSTPASGEPEFWDGEITWLTPDDLGGGEVRHLQSSRRKITDAGYASCGTSLAPAGSIVVSTRAPIGHVGHTEVATCTNQGCRTLVPSPQIDSTYSYYALLAARDDLAARGNGTTFMELSSGGLKDVCLPLPSISEQHAIAAFLDRETARIDAIIERKRRLIEVLQDKRAAVISAAVTKGLNKNVPLRDSGIAWLGMIPRHWNLQRFKHVTKRVDVGIAEAATHAYADEGVPLIRSTDVLRNELRTSGLLAIEPWFARRNRSKSLHSGDLVTVRTGAPGTTAVVPEELDGCQCFTLLMSTMKDHHHSPYFCYYLNSTAAVTYFQLVGWGTAQINISVPILKEAPVPVPPLSEQHEISDACRMYERRFRAAISTAEKMIDRLAEYRSALIAAAVTGQIDVNEAV